MARLSWVVVLLIGLYLAFSWHQLSETRRTYDALQEAAREGRAYERAFGRTHQQRPDAACWKAMKPWTAPDTLTTGMWIMGAERGVQGICYATQADCEAAWEATDPEHVKWDGFCWDTDQNPQDVGW